MVPIGHPGQQHNIHPSHPMPTMPTAPTGPNTLSTNQSTKATSSVVSSVTYVFKIFCLYQFNQLFVSETKLYIEIHIGWSYESSFGCKIQREWGMACKFL